MVDAKVVKKLRSIRMKVGVGTAGRCGMPSKQERLKVMGNLRHECRNSVVAGLFQCRCRLAFLRPALLAQARLLFTFMYTMKGSEAIFCFQMSDNY